MEAQEILNKIQVIMLSGGNEKDQLSSIVSLLSNNDKSDYNTIISILEKFVA